MLLALLNDPIFWLALFAFVSVVFYFYWEEKKQKEKSQSEKITELQKRIKKLEENQKQN